MEDKQLKAYPFRTPFYAELPTVWTEGDDLYIKSSSFQYVMSLFSQCRIVHINKASKIVEIKDKTGWKWENPIRISYSKIDYIDLISSELPQPDINYHSDIFDLFIVTKDPFKRVFLFKFGRIGTAGSIYHDTAKGCADLIVKHTNTRLGLYNPDDLPLADFNDKYICTACGHRLPPQSEFILCPYCGGQEIRIA